MCLSGLGSFTTAPDMLEYAILEYSSNMSDNFICAAVSVPVRLSAVHSESALRISSPFLKAGAKSICTSFTEISVLFFAILCIRLFAASTLPARLSTVPLTSSLPAIPAATISLASICISKLRMLASRAVSLSILPPGFMDLSISESLFRFLSIVLFILSSSAFFLAATSAEEICICSNRELSIAPFASMIHASIELPGCVCCGSCLAIWPASAMPIALAPGCTGAVNPAPLPVIINAPCSSLDTGLVADTSSFILFANFLMNSKPASIFCLGVAFLGFSIMLIMSSIKPASKAPIARPKTMSAVWRIRSAAFSLFPIKSECICLATRSRNRPLLYSIFRRVPMVTLPFLLAFSFATR